MINLAVKLLGRRTAWRASRAFYMAARGETPNGIDVNGEADLIRACVAAADPARGFAAIDVGANLGAWSQVVLDESKARGTTARLDLFEPVPGALARLRARFADERRATIHAIAASDTVGEAQMNIVGDHAGTNSLSPSIDPAASAITVPTTTLDAFVGGERHVDLIKIDAEGHDFAILRGLGEALARRQVGVVQFEYNWRWLTNGASLYAVFDWLPAGYALGRVAPGGIELIERWVPELDRFFEGNFALVDEALLDTLPVRHTRWDESNALVPLTR